MLGAALLAACVPFASAPRPPQPRVPLRLADSTFWRLMNEYSEPWGVFRSENFVSNETSYQWVISELLSRVKPGGVYLGVAPDQNFTYIVALKPRVAFIVDIRHQNAVQHLMYKALIEMSRDRAEFLSKLFSKPSLAGVDTSSSAAALFDALANQRADSLTYNYSSDCKNPGPVSGGLGRGGGGVGGGGETRGPFGMPSYLALVTETDGTGRNRGYLATEANFRALKEMEERNLIVPLTGNFAGDKAVRRGPVCA